MRSGFFGVFVFVSLVIAMFALTRSQAPRADSLGMAAYLINAPSVVLVEGDERATGFVVAKDQQFAYIATAAHAIDQGRWFDNANAPATVGGLPNARLSPSDFLSVRLPRTGVVLPADIVGEPDFDRDIVIARIPAAGALLKPVCLANHFQSNTDVGLAAFALSFLNGDVPSRPFDAYETSQTGNAATRVSSLGGADDEFEFNIPSNKGFSGGPVYSVQNGLVDGLVRRSASALIGDATPTMLGDSVEVINTALTKALGDVSVPTIRVDGDFYDDAVPDLGAAGKVHLLRFDDLADGSGNIPAAYANQERTVEIAFESAFGQQRLKARLLPADNGRSVKIGTPLARFADHICTVEGQSTAGAVALRRRLAPAAHGGRELRERIVLLDCAANIIDSIDVAPVIVGGDGSLSNDQAAALGTALKSALATLAGPLHRRLPNFALDGIALDDGETRGYYAVHSANGHVLVSNGWLGSAGADRAHLSGQIEVTAIAGRASSSPIATLTSSELDGLLNAAGPAGVAITSPTPGAPQRLIGADRCFLLQRRQATIQDGTYEHHIGPGGDTP